MRACDRLSLPLAFAAGLALSTGSLQAQQIEHEIRSQVLRFVEAVNNGDASDLADLYVRDSTVGSLGDGQITKRWADVGDLLEAVFAEPGLIRMTVDSVTVASLGDRAAIAFFRYFWEYRTDPPTSVTGAMTLVFVRSDGGWKVAHDHTSTLPVGNLGTEALRYSGPPNPVRSTSPCTISRIVDGDTIECQGVGRIRLIGMDTPEMSQEPYGAQATQVLANLISNSLEVELELDVEERDRYGRLLAYLWADGQMLNWILVRSGWAVVLTYPPNVQYVDWFTQGQGLAREEGAGLWGSGGFDCLPIDRRRGRCE
jgi:micrococcal nuclease